MAVNWYQLFQKSKMEYDKAQNSGNYIVARQKASECATYLINVSKNSNDGEQKKDLEEKANKWLEIAKSPIQVTEDESGNEGDYSETIESLIMTSKVKWNDVGGLDGAIKFLQENISIAGMNKPESIEPDRGIMLFGPPGTGKSLLAAACAGGLNSTFFNVGLDSILSKYFGQSSKLIVELYSSARKNEPSTVFVDEFDSLTMSRDGESSDAARRVLSTILGQLDGMQDKKSNKFVLTLAATNTPWDLDKAILRRFPQRIYVPLPNENACKDILTLHTNGLDISKLDLNKLVKLCVQNLYSGSDIKHLCMQSIRHMVREVNPDLHEFIQKYPYKELKQEDLVVRPLYMDDFKKAVKAVKAPIDSDDILRYNDWNQKFGSELEL